MNKNRKLTRREAHVAHVYATEMYPEEYLRRERAMKWQPVKDALEVIALTAVTAIVAVTAYCFLAIA